MNTLVLRNSRADCGTWLFAGGLLCVICLAALIGLIVANLRDPAARWMGSNVQSPQIVYLFLEGLAFVIALGMGALAFYKGKKFFDRSVQLTIDETGIHDHRKGKRIAWSEVDGIDNRTMLSGGIVTMAQLEVRMEKGSTVAVDIMSLDQDHGAIFKAARKILKQATRQS
jgi:hypothetical protein